MSKAKYEIEYTILDMSELSTVDQNLLNRARTSMESAYAPYSHFIVGCALLLANGEIVTGSNQENASFPAGLCAEMVGLSAASSNYPEVAVMKIAIATSKDSEILTAPCGICRQSLSEYEGRFDQNIAILLCKGEKVLYFESVKSLLPFAFDKNALKK